MSTVILKVFMYIIFKSLIEFMSPINQIQLNYEITQAHFFTILF